MTITKHFFKLLYSVTIISSLLLSNSCEKSDKPFEPPPPIPIKDTITVSVESVSHRSISININKKLNLKGDTYQLNRIYQDDKVFIYNYSITGNDTIIVDDNQGEGLELNTTYGYTVFRFDSLNVKKDSSNTVYATTLSATSHDYTWEVITIGEWQSWLSDVWGTNENNIYATGRVVLDGQTHGLLHYDGLSWSATSGVGGSSIFGFSDNDVWIAGGAVFHFDGETWEQIDAYTSNGQSIPLDQVLFDNTPYTGIWGTSSSNLYFTGLEGKIVYWDGEKGTLVETPTTIDLTDIYGLSQDFILATGSGSTYPSTSLIFNGQYWDILENLHYEYELYKSMYPISRTEYYLGGSVSYHYFGKIWNQLLIGTEGMIRKIRGDVATGDIVAVGGITALYHYNGEGWFNYSPELEDERAILHGVYVKNGTIFAVGTDGTYAKIFIGRRN
jgi:hypothetical protein